MKNGFKIGELAKLLDVPVETVRYYERRGLIPAPPRTMAGYRLYSGVALERVKMIRRFRELGFSLEEVGELLAIFDKEEHPCSEVHCRIKAKLLELEDHISGLLRAKSNLQAVIHLCESGASKCSVLATIVLAQHVAGTMPAQGDCGA